MARSFCESSKMRLTESNQALSAALNQLLEGEKLARIELAKRMGVADGTLGRIKYGKGNPTLEVVDQIARYYRVPAWRLIQPVAVREDGGSYISPSLGKLIDLVSKLPQEKQDALVELLTK